MKILHVIDTTNPKTGGPVEGLKQLYKYYKKKKINVEILSSDNNLYSNNLKKDLPKINIAGKQSFFFRYNSKLIPWLEKNIYKYDLLIVHGIWLYHNFAVMNVANRFNKPYFVFTHGAMAPWLNKFLTFKYIKKKIFFSLFQRKFLLRAKAVFFTSLTEMNNAKKEFNLSGVKKKYIGYGIFGNQNTNNFNKKKFLEKFPNFKYKKIILYLGRIHEIKGIDILIKSFLKLYSKNKLFHLIIAGPANKNYLKKLKALNDGSNENITWFSDVYGKFKWDLFNVSDFFCQPSHHENFGITIVEALSSKKPVIISNKVNIFKTIKNYNAGLIANDNQNSFDKTLLRINFISNKDYKKLSNSAYMCFKTNFSLERYFNKYLSYIKSQHKI